MKNLLWKLNIFQTVSPFSRLQFILSINQLIFSNFSAIPEDGVAEESEDEEKVNPDERLPTQATDKRVAPDNEFSDSEDEGSGGRRDNRSFKTAGVVAAAGGGGGRQTANKRPRLDTTQPDQTAQAQGEAVPANPTAVQPTPDSKGECWCSAYVWKGVSRKEGSLTLINLEGYHWVISQN
jgi:hypothetical protein